jgi:hypothetical protein
MQYFHLRAGDNAPKLTATLLAADGNPIDLSGGTCALKVYNPNGSLKFQTSATGPADGALDSTGQVEVAWTSALITPRGRFRMEFVTNTAGGEIQTIPNWGEELWLEIL